MAKLKIDRSINLDIEKGESVTVPADEVWKISAHECEYFSINGHKPAFGNATVQPFAYTIGGGTRLSGTYSVAITGVAFKVIKEE